MNDSLFTIGHSTHKLERFVALLKQHQIEVIYDVRSAPYSRYNPQYNREDLKASLAKHGIEYVFAGDRLGARSDNPAHYVNGKVQYDRLAQSDRFKQGLAAVCQAAAQKRIALMCAEKDPIDCHRAILVCRHLRGRIGDIEHILEDGRTESQSQLEARLRPQSSAVQMSMFESNPATDDDIETAYTKQGARIAYSIAGSKASQLAGQTDEAGE